jgi:transposase
LINAIRGRLTEFRWVAPKGPPHISVLAGLLDESEELGASLPEAAQTIFVVIAEQPKQLSDQVAPFEKEIARSAREDVSARQLRTIPGIGPSNATATRQTSPLPRQPSLTVNRCCIVRLSCLLDLPHEGSRWSAAAVRGNP